MAPVVAYRQERRGDKSGNQPKGNDAKPGGVDGESSGEGEVRPGHRRKRLTREERKMKRQRKSKSCHPMSVPRGDLEFTEGRLPQ
ncbi:hypothetical protein Pmar_PMAR016790, partial [Perkinsus marinus ATCC 50983]